jgi:uncharacterized phage protein gp47/JayE
MPYFAPFIDATGLHIPTYQDIEDKLVADAKRIFGSDIYLGPDSQDYQLIVENARAAYDTMLTAQYVYNNRSPVTAVQNALESIVAINGIKKKGKTFSLVTLTLTGTPFTVIQNGIVADSNSNLWDLPPAVTLDAGGTANVTATCRNPGPITALAGQVNIIMTPTQGWTSVTNANAASPGREIETDSELRARQKVTVANPSQALTTGILGAVLNLSNVVSAQLYENDSSSPVTVIKGVTNPDGYPAKSITMVVDGGSDSEIASTIASRKTPGCFTNGLTSVTVYDRFGVPSVIRFSRPINTAIKVQIDITPMTGYSSEVGTAIKQALLAYVGNLKAGQNVIRSELWQAVLSADKSDYPVFSLDNVQLALAANALGTANLVMQYNKKATLDIGGIVLIEAV